VEVDGLSCVPGRLMGQKALLPRGKPNEPISSRRQADRALSP
jgi:hypothetical protein